MQLAHSGAPSRLEDYLSMRNLLDIAVFCFIGALVTLLFSALFNLHTLTLISFVLVVAFALATILGDAKLDEMLIEMEEDALPDDAEGVRP